MQTCPNCKSSEPDAAVMCGLCGHLFVVKPRPMPVAPAVKPTAKQRWQAMRDKLYRFTFGEPKQLVIGTMACPVCKREVSIHAKSCPGCGDPLRKHGLTRAHNNVSRSWAIVGGCFYFAAKGWWKSAVLAFMLALATAGISWLFVGLFAQGFVDYVEA